MEIQVYTCIIPFLLIIQTTVSLSTDETTQLKEDECFSLLAHATIDAADLHWEMKSLRGRATPNRIKVNVSLLLMLEFMRLEHAWSNW